LVGGERKGNEWEKVEWEWKGRSGLVEIACVEFDMVLILPDR
jgi:hypothetical protein